MAKLQQRIYTYRNRRLYTHVANLTDHLVYIAWMGRMGCTLPPLTKDTVPRFLMVRPYKGTRKRLWQAEQMEKLVYDPKSNPDGIIALGTLTEVEAAMEAKLPKT